MPNNSSRVNCKTAVTCRDFSFHTNTIYNPELSCKADWSSNNSVVHQSDRYALMHLRYQLQDENVFQFLVRAKPYFKLLSLHFGRPRCAGHSQITFQNLCLACVASTANEFFWNHQHFAWIVCGLTGCKPFYCTTLLQLYIYHPIIFIELVEKIETFHVFRLNLLVLYTVLPILAV